MNLLAIETATNVCSVAVWKRGSVACELTLNRPRAHAENIVPLISDALTYAGLKPSDIGVVAVSAGPGSYTGLRIGASTAKGFAVAVDASLVAVPSLAALAESARGAMANGDVIVAAFDARRDEVFAAAFRSGPSSTLTTFRPTAAVIVADAAEWLDAADARVVLVGDGAEKMRIAFADAGRSADLLSPTVFHPRAATVAVLGARLIEDGQMVDVAEFEPHYLKDFVATRPTATAFEKLPF